MTATTKHSRRTVLAGIAGGAVATAATTAIAAVPAPGPDPLIAMEAEYLAAWDAWGAALRELDEADMAVEAVPYMTIGGSVVSSEDDIRRWCQHPPERERLIAEFRKRKAKYEAAGAEAGLPALEAASDAADNHALALLRKIATTPAVSLEGVAVKLRLAEHSGDSLPDSFGFDLVQVARLDAERLARGGVA